MITQNTNQYAYFKKLSFLYNIVVSYKALGGCKMNTKNQGYVMALVGSILLLYNALSYIFGWESRSSAFTILGLIFVIIY